MKEENIYKQALASSIEQVVNAMQQSKEYLHRLGKMKAYEVFNKCIGERYRSDELKNEATVVAVSFSVTDEVWRIGRNSNNDVNIKIAFARNVDALLKDKKVTEAERKCLKRVNAMLDSAERAKTYKYSYYFSKDTLDEAREIQMELTTLKNNLNVIEIATWCFSLSDVLDDNFIEKGLSYDNQTIY